PRRPPLPNLRGPAKLGLAGPPPAQVSIAVPLTMPQRPACQIPRGIASQFSRRSNPTAKPASATCPSPTASNGQAVVNTQSPTCNRLLAVPQMLTVRPEAVARDWPLGLRLMASTWPGWDSDSSSWPITGSQILTVLSALAVTRRLPSLLYVTRLIASSWPLSVISLARLSKSQTIKRRSLPPEARRFPSG